MAPVVEAILIVAMLAGLGAAFRRKGRFSDSSIGTVSFLMMTVAQPALMISSTQCACNPETLGGFLTVMGLSFAAVSLMLLGAYAISRFAQETTRPVLALTAALPNIGFIGIPIIQALYGEGEAMLYLTGYIIGFNLSVWSVGISLFSGFGFKSLKNLVNPILCAAALGLVLFFLRIPLPGPILRAVSMLSDLNTPLAMLVVGARLADVTGREFADWRVWASTAVKNLAMPLMVLAVCRLLRLPEMVTNVLTIGSALPSGTLCEILAEHHQADVYFAVKTIAVSTLLCMLTLPLIQLCIG